MHYEAAVQYNAMRKRNAMHWENAEDSLPLPWTKRSFSPCTTQTGALQCSVFSQKHYKVLVAAADATL